MFKLVKLALPAVSFFIASYAYASTHSLVQGWNLEGNNNGAAVDPVAVFGNATTPTSLSSSVTTVWVWDKNLAQWDFFAPSMTPTALTTYAASKGYGVLTSIQDGEGFWVNANTAVSVNLTASPAGTSINATADTTAQNLTVGTTMVSFTPIMASGGATPYTYSYTGTLPLGLSFDASTGAVTGTPSATYATANLIFSVKDANNVVASTTSTVSFTVSASTSANTQMGGGKEGVALSLAGSVTTFVGSQGSAGFANGTGTVATFNYPSAVTTDGTNLYVIDAQNNAIRQIVISTGVVTTLAGSGTAGFVNGTGTAASFRFALFSGITTDGTNLYVADSGNYVIRKIVISTGEVTTLAVSGIPYSINTFFYGITTDGTNLYVADNSTYDIRKIVISTGVMSVLAGGGLGNLTNGTGTAASFNNPVGITTDGTNLYVADEYNKVIRKIVISTGLVSTLAGGGVSEVTNGTGTAASFFEPVGITTDGTNLYITDTGTSIIRQIVISTGVVTTLAGASGGNSFVNYGISGFANGIGAAAKFNNPVGITTDGTSLYVADQTNQVIREIR